MNLVTYGQWHVMNSPDSAPAMIVPTDESGPMVLVVSVPTPLPKTKVRNVLTAGLAVTLNDPPPVTCVWRGRVLSGPCSRMWMTV